MTKQLDSCVYVYVYGYVCVCIHIYICIYIYTYIYIYVYIYIYLAKGPQSVSARFEIWDLIIYYTLATLGMWGPST